MVFKAKKKGVRFADLYYTDDVDEDTDSADSMTDVTATASTTAAMKAGDGKTAGLFVPPPAQQH